MAGNKNSLLAQLNHEESDDSKDSGRLSQDEGPANELSDSGITFGKQATEGDDEDEAEEEDLLERQSAAIAADCEYDSSEEDQEESCLLGIDCNEVSTVGLVLRIYADTKIHLDGDG